MANLPSAADPPPPPSMPLPLPLPPAAAPVNTRSRLVRGLYMLLAVCSLVLGVVGIFLPGLPTTPFILLAAWAASRSSPRLHGWLLQHRLFGPMVRNWQQGGTVSRRAKWSASAAMAVCAVVLLLVARPAWLGYVAIGCIACVLGWLWRRPEPGRGEG